MNRLRRISHAAGLAGVLVMMEVWPAAADEPYFPDPEAALEAFREALQTPDGETLLELLGPEYRDELIGGDPASARETMAAARNAAAEALVLVPGDEPGTFDLLLGREGWPLPIPLVEDDQGWRFDTEAGLEEIIDRRIGENELAAIAGARAYVEAQRLYSTLDPNGDGVPEFATRLSTLEHSGRA